VRCTILSAEPAMSSPASPEDAVRPTKAELSGPLLILVAIATGAFVANIYYAQPLIASIAPEIGVSPDLAGAIVGVTQIGYGAGLFFLVSLADLVENKTLVLSALGVTVLALLGIAFVGSAAPFLLASFVIGLSATGAQVLVPFMAHLAPEARRGAVVGKVMAGLLTGIMLARPAALFIAASFGWRTVFLASAGLMLVIGACLARMMPRYRPHGGLHYGQILASMAGLLRDIPVLRWRAAYQALMFAGFNLLWTAAPLMLADRFGLTESGIGFFALAGAGGALAAPLAGHLADRGHSRLATGGAMLTLALSFLGSDWAVATLALAALVVFVVLLDAAVQMTQVTSQRAIFSVAAAVRGRANAIYMTITFMGGALGSILGAMTYHAGGWNLTALTGAGLGVALLILFACEHSFARR
jgi:predicted MFS family arabinose efflux permease